MSIDELGKIANTIILLILGICIIVKNSDIAGACRTYKVKLFGPATYDQFSELVAKIGIIFIGICFGAGSLLLTYQFFVS